MRTNHSSEPVDGAPVAVEGASAIQQIEAGILPGKDLADWDSFVRGHPDGMPYHLTGWKRFLEDVFPHIKGEFLVLKGTSSGEIRAGIPLYTAKSLVLGDRLVSSPYATLGGTLCSSSEDVGALVSQLLEEFDRSGCKRLEIRGVRQAQSTWDEQFMHSASNLHHYIDLPQTPEELRRGFSKGAKRKLARVEKAGIEVVEADSPDSLRSFSALHQTTRKRLGLPPFPGRFFFALREHLTESIVTVHLAMKRGEVLGGLMSLELGDRVIFEHLGDSSEGRGLGVNYLLLWKSMERAVIQGKRIYSLGRTTPENSGLIQFKRAWGSTEEEISNLVYPGSGRAPRRGSNFPSRMARQMFRSLPTPLARCVGGVLYRHWA